MLLLNAQQRFLKQRFSTKIFKKMIKKRIKYIRRIKGGTTSINNETNKLNKHNKRSQ